MKRKLKGVLGVALTLVMVLSLTVALAPIASASPGDNEWSKFAIPKVGSDGDFVMVNYTGTPNIGPIAMAINGDLYCYAWDTGDTDRLYKSEDGGYSWDDVGTDLAKELFVDIVCSATDADVLYIATATDVYKSENAGGKFKKVADSPGAAGIGGVTITSLDVTYYEGDYMLVVGMADSDAGQCGGIWLCDEGGRPFPTWEDQEVGNVPAGNGTSGGAYDVWDVAFSPNFEDDEQLLAVVVTEASAQLEYSGDATVEWSTTDPYSGSHSVKLTTPTGDTYEHMAGVYMPVDIALEDITELSFWKKVTAIDANGWNPNVILFIDANNDDDIDFDLTAAMEWHDTHSNILLGDDAFVVCECPAGLGTTADTVWVHLDALNHPDMKAWGADSSGNVSPTAGYAALSATNGFQDTSAGDIDPTDKVMGIAIVIGGSTNWQGETAYIDEVSIASDLEPAKTFVTTKLGSSGWDTIVDDIELQDADENPIAADAKAWITFPSDYDSEPDEGYYSLFVGVHCADASEGDVYLVLGDGEVSIDLDCTSSNITSLAIAGAADDAYLMAGTGAGDEGKVRRSTDGADTTGGSWKSCLKEPTGNASVYVVVADDVADTDQAWAAVGGNDGGVSLQVADRLWNTIGLIDTDIATINDLSLSGDTVFMTTNDGTNDCVWCYASEWERIFSETLADAGDLKPDLVEVSPYFAEDETVFFAQEDTDEKVFYSNDGGNRFKKQIRAIPGGTITGWVVIDEDTLIVGVNGGVYKTTNNGRSWSTLKSMSGAGDVESLVLAPGFAVDGAEDEGHILAGTSAGEVWRSTNGGTKWSELTTTIMAESVIPAFDADYAENSTMYCTDEEEGVFRFVKGESTTWVRIDATKGAPLTGTNGVIGPSKVDKGTGLVVSSDGTLYATDSSAAGEGISRSLDPTTTMVSDAPFFERVNQTVEGDLTKVLDGLWLTPGSNVLWSIFGGDNIYTLEDTLTGSPSLNAPANKKSSMRVTSVTFQWEAMAGAKKYELKVNTHENFKGANVIESMTGDDSVVTKDTVYTLVNIPAAYQGIPLYWKVRVYEQEPYRSNSSDVWYFSTQLVEAQWNPFVGGVPEAPANGATNVPLVPTFAWNAADWATGYDWQIALDAGFTQPGWSLTGKNALTTTVYLSEHELEYSTTYYWRVRAISATSQSEWASAVFTTMAEPVEAPPPITVGPPAPPPAPIVLPTPIPAYLLWTIVGIGAALIIAVIVLIARTRRVT